MRIYFDSMAHPKRLSKRLSDYASIKLSASHQIISRLFGYADWHELEEVTAAARRPPSKPDYLVSDAVKMSRFDFMWQRMLDMGVELDLDWHEPDAYKLLEVLAPMDTLPWAGANPISDIFPVDMSIPFGLIDPHIGGEIPSDLLTFEVGGDDAKRLLGELKDVVAVRAEHRLDPKFGFRCLSVRRKVPCDDVDEELPVSTIVFRPFPKIEEDVVTDIELEIHPVSYCSEYLSSEEVEAICHALLFYLSNCSVWADSNSDYSGAFHGIDLTVTGVVKNAGAAGVLEYLEEVCDEIVGSLEMYGPPFDAPGLGAYEGYIPIKSFEDISRLEILPDDDDDEETEGIADVADMILAHINAFMQDSPQHLAEYLRQNGKADFADFAEKHHTNSESGIVDFLGFVRSITKADAIPFELSIAIRHWFVDRKLYALPGEHELSLEEAIDMYACQAKEWGDESLATMAREKGLEHLFAICAMGQAELGLAAFRSSDRAEAE